MAVGNTDNSANEPASETLIPQGASRARSKFVVSKSVKNRVMAGFVGAMVILVCLVVGLTVAAVTTDNSEYRFEKDAVYWHNLASEELSNTLSAMLPGGVAKNVILFLGDGMGPTSVTAGRILAGQLEGKRGEEYKLAFDNFPFTGLSMTYSLDTQVPDSAATATAFLSGVKTNQRLLGISGRGEMGVCSTASEENHVKSILRWSLEQGKSAGIVTTTRVTHATPAASYAHSVNRDWESDRLIPDGQKECEDIALQLIKNNKDIQVVLGGGRAYFLPEGVEDPDPSPTYNTSWVSRTDGNNLIEMWKQDKAQAQKSHSFVYNKEGFDQVDPSQTDYLLGLFAQSHMAYDVNRNSSKEPSLAEMTEKAIRILRKNDNGFFLLVEGGRIDHGHHANEGSRALHDVVAMSKAVEAATQLTRADDTLIVVTADHSHVMSIAGYPQRGNPILGKTVPMVDTNDGKPYTTIVYGNGPGWTEVRENITDVDTEQPSYKQQAAVPMRSETHGGEDVAIYARGPQSFLYTGVHEQNYIPMVMAYASCVGPYQDSNKNCAKYQNNLFVQMPSSLNSATPTNLSSGILLPIATAMIVLLEYTRQINIC